MNKELTGLPIVADPAREQFKIIAGSEALEGRLLIVECVIHAGGEPPLRRHQHEDVLLFVLDGLVTFHVDGQLHHAGPGGSLIVPKGCAHGFTVESESARLLIVLSPAGAEELMVQLFGDPSPHNNLSRDRACEEIDSNVTTAARYGVDITGPAPGPA